MNERMIGRERVRKKTFKRVRALIDGGILCLYLERSYRALHDRRLLKG